MLWEMLRPDRVAARLRAAPPPDTKSGAEVVDLQQQVQGDGSEHQRGNDRHERSPAVRRCGAREGWRANVAAGLQSCAVIVNCDELHASRDELTKHA